MLKNKMRHLNKKAAGEANLETIGKYILWIAVVVIAGIGIYFLMKKLTTGI
jgi:hypothetical protein